jgi:hypothetical protein
MSETSTKTAAPPILVTPSSTPTSDTSETELGRILYVSQPALMTTDPTWTKPKEVGIYSINTCGSNTGTVSGETFNLYRSPKCAIGTGVAPAVCISPNGLLEVIASGRNGTITLRSTGDRESEFFVYAGELNLGEGIRWAPDSGSFLFVTSGNTLTIAGLDGSYRQIAFPGYEPTYSISGDSILYLKPISSGIRDVFVINSDGSDERNVTNASNVNKVCPAWRK